jgi:hypothetical protein
MKKTTFIFLALSIFLLVSVEKSFACTCMMSPEPLKKQVKTAFSDSAAIFEGEVLEVSQSTEKEFEFVVRIKISKSWKGEQTGEITITTANQSSLCGYNFEVGKKYLVYAHGSKERLYVDNCSRTSGFNNNGDIKYLKKLRSKKPSVS